MTASQGTVLVVDDELMNREMLNHRLKMVNYTVVCAEGGDEALEQLREQPFDAVLLDVNMPGKNGYEVLAEIRKIYSPIDLPVLMVTAETENEAMVSAFEIGANEYITKPINFPVALARLNGHISSKRLSAQLRESETRYSLSAQGANDGLWDWDLVSDTIHYSDRWKSMLGFGLDEIGNAPEEWFGRVHPEDLPHVERALADHRAGLTEQFESEHRMLHHDNTYRWVLTRGVAIRDTAGRETRMAGSQTDITRGKAADPLTGLPNRVLFMDHLDAAIKASQDESRNLFAVLFLDLDRFKVVNDSLGHHAGDDLLVKVARRLESCMRSSDVVSRMNDRCTIARFGGDEFVLLLNGIDNPENACRAADRILRVLAKPFSVQGQDVSVSASIGIAVGDQDRQHTADLMRDADTAMYHAKANGKAQWCLFDQTMRDRAIERLALESDLKKGLQNGEFCVYYQPIVSLPSGRIEGFEALLRWEHKTRGFVSPEEFIPVAEETGFIVELGKWVLQEACRQMQQWQTDYPDEDPDYISVNVSARQLADGGFAGCVQECLRQTNLKPECLKLEITESAIMGNPHVAARSLKQLCKMGVGISVDDFGTGYSSLSYLQQFPIDKLKIDRSFIQRLGDSEEAQEIVRTIITLAHSLGMEVTAEGIEEVSHQAKLQEIACESGQGYLYSRPVPASMIEELLKGDHHCLPDDFAGAGPLVAVEPATPPAPSHSS